MDNGNDRIIHTMNHFKRKEKKAFAKKVGKPYSTCDRPPRLLFLYKCMVFGILLLASIYARLGK